MSRGTCVYCGVATTLEPNLPTTATMDHYIPKCKMKKKMKIVRKLPQGERYMQEMSNFKNKVLACSQCNSKKGCSNKHPITGKELPKNIDEFLEK